MSSIEAAKKVRIQDVKPYDAPASLDELHGPRSGTVGLPPWVYWGPDATFDVESADIVAAYQATIQEGRTVDQVQILNRELLIAIWPELAMPARVRKLWEGRFPELTAAA
jgi:hypothetical protein